MELNEVKIAVKNRSALKNKYYYDVLDTDRCVPGYLYQGIIWRFDGHVMTGSDISAKLYGKEAKEIALQWWLKNHSGELSKLLYA